MNRQNKTVVIGAGVAGLTTAALLLEAGHKVTVLEAQAYPGGCAGTFFYQNYRFDAGATLAGGFAPGGPHHQVAQRLGLQWPTTPVTPVAWTVHLPDGRSVSQWTDMAHWREARQRAFPTAERFWHKQEQLADIAWDVSTRHFPWPPQDMRDLFDLGLALRPKTFLSTPYILRSIGSFMPKNDPMLRTFVDANLLISAQATADKANALYGSAALELPRRGVSHVASGIGGIADTLVAWIRSKGGSIFFKQSVDQIEVRNGKAVAVHTNQSKRQSKRLTVECDTLIGNLTPWGLQKLLATDTPPKLAAETVKRGSTWGAFMLYIGLDESKLPVDLVEHHQVVRDHTKPLGETNSIFISISPAGESGRAPNGMRAANISTHTKIEPWWALRDDPQGEQAYLERRERYVEAMLNSAEIAIPGFKQAAKMILPATPVTYKHWTGRPLGMVGGFPQTSILDARGPQTGLANCWLVGDSVFPGQSTAGVTLSALRVAEKVRQRTL